MHCVHARDVGALAAGAVGLMLVGFAEGLGAAKTYAARKHQQIDANRELLGLGTANLAAALSSGLVVAGSLSKTAVNASAGARTQLSGLIVAALTIVTLLAFTGLFEDLPVATLAAVVIAAVIELIDTPALISLYRAYSRRLGREFGLVARPDFVAAIAALLGVTVFDPLPGLSIGITVSLLLLIYRASRPHIATLGKAPGTDGPYRDTDRHPDARPPDHIAVLRAESGLYFANADAVRTRILQAATAHHISAVVLDAETVPYIDVTASRMLADLTDELNHRGVQLLIAVRSDRSATSSATSSTRPSSRTSIRPSRQRSTPPTQPPERHPRETARHLPGSRSLRCRHMLHLSQISQSRTCPPRVMQRSNAASRTGSLYAISPLPCQGLATLFMTHPPIAERIRRLRALDGDRVVALAA